MKLEEYLEKRQQDPEYIAAKKELKPLLDFADKVLDLRLEKGWSQAELARRVGAKRANISRIESGLVNPTVKFLSDLWQREGTLNWGNPKDWIEIGWVQCLVDAPTDDHYNVYLEQYSVLQDIARITRLQKLDTMYRSRDAVAVQRFLWNHPHLIDVILEAYPYLKKHFGPATQFALEVISDPEAAGQDQMFAYIITPLPVGQALAQLEKLDEEWFLNQLDRVGDLFNFDLECV